MKAFQARPGRAKEAGFGVARSREAIHEIAASPVNLATAPAWADTPGL